MRDWDARHLAAAAGATLVRRSTAEEGAPGPERASIDSRRIAPGELFVGLRGERSDGGSHAEQALQAGGWGVLVAPEHAERAAETAAGGVVLAHGDPLAGLHSLARAWRRELRARGAMVVAITGSTGKTSTKDILAALLGERLQVAASPENFNTEIGLPLALLSAPAQTELLVLEMAMRGPGQIAELTEIAEPEVGVIVNVGPAHLELLGSLDAIAAAKAELIAGLAPGASVVVPAGEPLLVPHLRAEVPVITFGEGGEVTLAERRADGSVLIRHGEAEIELQPSFAQAHNLSNLLAAVAAARA
ncbi:MAG: Mur ligase family protein, partial [Solirubrobacteraceae bacterium]